MRVLVLQHEWNDGPGYLGEALQRRGSALDVVRLDREERIPDMDPYEMLLVMGGEMNVYQEERHPWLAEEILTIHQTVQSGKAVLGVCLGGQLLAKALGAKVRLGAAHEIGLVRLTLTEDGNDDPFFAGLPALEAVEWHDDTFDIPGGAARLARSAGCANQAFRYGRCAYGLQFHPEVSPEMLSSWFDDFSGAPLDRDTFQRAVRTNEVKLRDQAEKLIANFLNATDLR